MKVFLSSYVAPQPCYLEWRGEATLLLNLHGLAAVDPVAGMDPDRWDHAGLVDSSVPGSFLTVADLFRLERSDAVLLRAFPNLPRQSIGTWFEFSRAVSLGLPVVVVTEDRMVEAHPFVRQFAGIIVDNLREGVEWISRLA